MTTFFLIRHGDKRAIPPDPELNELGKQQAEDAAAFLQKYQLERVMSSPLKRAQQTAEYTAVHQGLPIHIDERLRERINWGDDPLLDRATFIQVWKETTLNRDLIPQFGFSSRQAGQNLRNVIVECASQELNTVALFTHGGVIADFLRNELSEDQLSSIKVIYPDGYDYEIHECSVTTVTYEPHTQEIAVLSINRTEHLRSLSPDTDAN